MKRIALMIILLSTLLWADYYSPGSMAVSLSAVTTTGAGTAFAMPTINGTTPNKFTWQSVLSGTATSITVNLEGSLDNVTYFQMDQSTSTTTESRSVVNKPVKWVRCNITSYTTNSTNETCQFVATW